MKTSFYNRTVYVLLGVPVPQCFIDLDEYFDTRFTSYSEAFTRQSAILAENLCCRMANVELFVSQISDAQKTLDFPRAAILIGTLMVGYFTACKAVLDAGAITLARIYQLPLSNKEMDFSKGKFWKELEKESPIVYSRYAPFRAFFDDIVKWRDSAVHRVTPFVITHSPEDPYKLPREKQEIKMVAQPDAEISTLLKAPKSIPWVEPLHYHRKWQSQLIEICKEVCLDIRGQTL